MKDDGATESALLPEDTPTVASRLAARTPDGRSREVMRQSWRSLLFLHWPYPAGLIQATLPAGLSVDTFGGDAYVGVVPFFMRRVRPSRLPALPWISFFQELNVRTYVVDRRGVPGVWFYSLDCNQPLAVWAARAFFGLPYFHAGMRAARADWVDYSSIRKGTSSAARYRYRGRGPAAEAAPGSLDFFLLERYYLYASRPRGGSLLRGQVAHAPYRYQEAEVEQFSALPAQLDGLGELAGPPAHTCFVEGVDVRIFGAAAVA